MNADDTFDADTLPSPITGMHRARFFTETTRQGPAWSTVACPGCKAQTWRTSTRAPTYAICRTCDAMVWFSPDGRLDVVPKDRQDFVRLHVMATT